MHVRIVPMTADHLDEVAELERICFSAPWSRNMLAEELNNALSAMLVALDDSGRVVGYAGVQVILDEGYITNVAVRPECRRQGIAGKLLDVFLNFAGGFKVADPGLDLAVVASIVSSYYDRAIAEGVCCAGEIGLSGEVRPAPRTEQRVSEANRLGFRRIIVSGFLRKTLKVPKGIEVVYINNIGELPPALFCEKV